MSNLDKPWPLPCPFCDSEMIYYKRLAVAVRGFIECGSCFAGGPTGVHESDAVRLWNCAPRQQQEEVA